MKIRLKVGPAGGNEGGSSRLKRDGDDDVLECTVDD